MELETDRLTLRPLREADAPVLAQLWTDPDVTRFMGGPREYDEVYRTLLEDAKAEPQPPFDLWVLVEKSSGDIIGHCGILDKDIEGVIEYELTYVLAASVWGKGYATEIARAIRDKALAHGGLDRLVALIDPANHASANVARKAGFHHEKDVLRPDGHTKQLFTLTKR